MTYVICESLNPANCDTAVATVNVNAGNISADADTVLGVNGLTGAADVLNVLPGDLLNGSPATLTDVTLSVVTPAVPLTPGAPVPVLDPATGIVSVPAGTPADIVNRIQQETAKALNSPAVKERLLAQGAIPGGNTPAEFTSMIQSEITKWAAVVKASGARVD